MANLLILFGFSWMAVAALVGLALAKRHETAGEQLVKLAAEGKLSEYHRVDVAYKWNKTVHAHAFLFSVVVVCIGSAMPKMNYSETVINTLAIALMAAPVVWTIGGLRSNKALMGIGDLVLLVGIVASAIGLAKAL